MALTPSPSLGSQFDVATRDQWRRAVDLVLAKGADLSPEQLDQRFDRQLVATLADGVEVQPLYTSDDVDPAVLDAAGLPGFAPFIRGSTAGRSGETGWEVRQEVELVVTDPSGTAERVVAELERGASGVYLGLDRAANGSIHVDLLDAALAGVHLELVPVSLRGASSDAAAALVDLWDRRNVSPADSRGTLGCDPIGCAARAGGSPDTIDAEWAVVAELARRCTSERPLVRAVVADATPYHGAGAGDAQEIGCVLAAGVVALRALTGHGLDVDSAVRQIEVRVAASADQFVTIAKLRAVRGLWNRIGEVAGASETARAARIHAVTSSVMLTRYDPWVNLLRNTVACFAAGVGGADAVTVMPHDGAANPGLPSDLARRMARNTHAVLTDESNLARAIDPAGGSWYVESLTEALADAAWAWFQEIEAAGGMVAALDAGLVHDRIASTWEARSRRLATRAEPITGISEFPAIAEQSPPALPPTPVAEVVSRIAPLPRVRRSDGFEALREAADDATAERGARPTVVLVGLGTPADHNTRSGFAKNLFEAGGFATVLVEGASPDDLADEVHRRGITIACLCSSDVMYAELAARAAEVLTRAGVDRLYLAGKAGDQGDAWAAAGIDQYVFAGCDALEVLGSLHDHLSIRRADNTGEDAR